MSKIKLTLRIRIYLSMMALIIISFIFTGITAFSNYKKQNEAYHDARFKRKEAAVLESMNYFLENRGGHLDPDSVIFAFSDKICELSDVHNLHIALYSLQGVMLIEAPLEDASDSLFLDDTIDWAVFKQLAAGYERAQADRNIGGKNFILAYWYFKDMDGKPVAITNVRYDKTQINREELRGFLLGLTYIYLALFAGAAILAFVLSNYITKSLARIGNKMKSIRLGERNEPIIWDSQDEIGELVEEYNRMLQQVEESAKQLARSERESAWREMAKQVAHEIKNPLTPMKLRIQHLQRAWEDEAPDFQRMLNETSNSLIDQIETLTKIANEFSHFAQMPRAERESVDVEEVLKASVSTFESEKDYEISMESNLISDPRIFADRVQIMRVFNNLINNAVQAIPRDEEGKIRVVIGEEGNTVVVEVNDNGVGIEEDQKDKIFVPNFTTKSTGMGLGLAMVKNIVENSGGKVWFNSRLGKGSSFFVSFPKKIDESIS